MMYAIVVKHEKNVINYDGYTKHGVTIVFFVPKNRIRGPPLIN